MSGPAGHASSRKRVTATHCSDELLPHGRQRPTHARSPKADPLSRRAGPSTPTADPRPPLGPPTHGLLARPRDGLSARACRTTLPSRRPTLAQRSPWPSAPRDPPVTLVTVMWMARRRLRNVASATPSCFRDVVLLLLLVDALQNDITNMRLDDWQGPPLSPTQSAIRTQML